MWNSNGAYHLKCILHRDILQWIDSTATVAARDDKVTRTIGVCAIVLILGPESCLHWDGQVKSVTDLCASKCAARVRAVLSSARCSIGRGTGACACSCASSCASSTCTWTRTGRTSTRVRRRVTRAGDGWRSRRVSFAIHTSDTCSTSASTCPRTAAGASRRRRTRRRRLVARVGSSVWPVRATLLLDRHPPQIRPGATTTCLHPCIRHGYLAHRPIIGHHRHQLLCLVLKIRSQHYPSQPLRYW